MVYFFYRRRRLGSSKRKKVQKKAKNDISLKIANFFSCSCFLFTGILLDSHRDASNKTRYPLQLSRLITPTRRSATGFADFIIFLFLLLFLALLVCLNFNTDLRLKPFPPLLEIFRNKITTILKLSTSVVERCLIFHFRNPSD